MTRRDDAKKGVLRAYDAVQRYLLAFFDAFVKRDAAARTRLTTQPPSSGPMIEITEYPAIVPALSRREFRARLGSNAAKALQVAREGLARDPNAAVFDETWLNGLGYELMQTGQQDRAIEVFRLNVEAHKTSANSLESLSEALEGAGQRAAALEAAESALKLSTQDMNTVCFT